MTSSPRALLPDLPKDYSFPPTTFELTPDFVTAYLDATCDEAPVYAEAALAPPLAVAARALGTLLDLVELPPGSLHTGQEMEVHAGIPSDATLELSGRVAQRSERAGMTIAALDFAVARGADVVMRGRTTVMMPKETIA